MLTCHFSHDILLPALDERRFTQALLAICPNSIPALSLAPSICGIEGYLFPYCGGDYRDCGQWLRADRGDKPQRIALSLEGLCAMLRIMDAVATRKVASPHTQPTQYEQSKHVFRPRLNWMASACGQPDGRALEHCNHKAETGQPA